ncbi:putative chloride channel 3 [Rosellinia necatrix]|uniref:Chloride channel protein n=1 Tax=Rosellinia necatrix TaxID=77044 RepID=A0A1W2TRQ9_ROSNE|nr:putative chloride channel 3 [Rosellinia necatrix]
MASNRNIISFHDEEEASSSSSLRSPNEPRPTAFRDEHDHDDHDDHDERHAAFDVLEDDPLSVDLGGAPMSFKRKKKESIFSNPSRMLSALTGNRFGSRPPAPGRPSSAGTATPTPLHTSDAAPGDAEAFISGHGSKDGLPLDWYAEGPGRRVGYEDLTAIDWIFEHTKERQRLRVLRSSATGLIGYVQQLADSSQVWIILVLTGLAVGGIAAAIDIVSNWLGDLKTGYCSSGPDAGAFYLNKQFCCLGYDQGDKCSGWKPWAAALGIGGVAGKWFIEYFFFLMFSITFALAAGLLVKEYAIYAKHSGLPEIKTVLGGFIIRRFLGGWTLVTKSLGLCLAVASGMWLGKEGPLVHVACCCANLFIKLFPIINGNEARKRAVLSAAASSGISVAFGSPIGGVLFSLEQLSYYFPDKTMWQSFVCAMTAAGVLQALDPFRSGKLVLYQVKFSTGWHGFEIIPFALLGILGGIYGGLFIKANMRVAQWKKSTTWLPGPLTQVVIVAFITAFINYPNFYMRAQASELVSSLFTDCNLVLDDPFALCKTGAASASTIVLLLFASILGFFLAAVTFGLQIPAGIILPSMAIGALFGRAVGIIMEIWQRSYPDFFAFGTCDPDVPCVTPGVYAIIGAAATLAGVTRLTVSIVVIMFELTGALTYVLPMMIAVMLSKWVGDAFSRRGIYESWIHFNGYPFLDSGDEGGGAQHVPDVTAAQIMTRVEDLVVLTATGHTVASLRAVLASCAHRGFPVVSDPRDAVLLGYISRSELAYSLAACGLPPETEAFFGRQPQSLPLAAAAADDDNDYTRPAAAASASALDLRPWMDQTPLTLPSRSALHLAVSYFQKLGVRYVLFSDRGVLQGLLTKKDVWYVLNGAEDPRRADPDLGHSSSPPGAQPHVVGSRGDLMADDDDDGDAGGDLLGASRNRLHPESPSDDRASGIL